MKDEINCSYIGGGYTYILQSVAIHFNHTVSSGRWNLSSLFIIMVKPYIHTGEFFLLPNYIERYLRLLKIY